MNKDIFNTNISRDEISKQIETYFDEQAKKGYNSVTVKVTFADKNCTVTISKMYEGLGNLVSFANMQWLSTLLGTDKIDLRNEYYREGCETCDYGSEQSVDFFCQDIQC
jgi:hypothetical protein